MQRVLHGLKSVSLYTYVLSLTIASISLSVFLFVSLQREYIETLFLYTLIIGSIPVWYSLLRDLSRGAFGVDIIAGVALIGTFIVHQYLAGVVVLLMLSGGQFFESYAMRRAKKELSSLLSRTPTFVHQKIGDQIKDIKVNKVSIGMEVLVKLGEVIAVDGTIIEGRTTIDESMLTGESMPVSKYPGSSVYRGTENTGSIIVVKVTTLAKDTKYQSIVSLVKHAEETRAPLVRLADTYSLYFTGITFVIALIAWLLSHDLVRVVAVLVVATPCPLLLATPIAIISGMSIASKRGIIVRDGGSLEALASTDAFVFDKTGTLTLGTPEVTSTISFGKEKETILLTLAASLDQLSMHPLGRALVHYSQRKKIKTIYPKMFEEHFGDGVSGVIGKTRYYFGKRSSMPLRLTKEEETLVASKTKEGAVVAFLGTNKRILGAIFFEDIIRDDSALLFKKIHDSGIRKTVILTGDTEERGKAVGKILNVTEVMSECLPEDKVKKIKRLEHNAYKVTMVGDGINDAPALTAATVGISVGNHGNTVASDAADIVILSSSVSRVYDVLHIAKKTVGLAKQGMLAGIGASTFLMVVATLGYIPPLTGTILQEGIDVVVILNALRLSSMVKFD